MTESPPLVSNPFALMLDPEAVLRAVEQSQRLPALRRRICRPLDKSTTPCDDDREAFDRRVDATPETD
jgi:hypothetical protein